MAGHSHWAQIKHKKALEDKKRGKIFSKVARIIQVAARKGADPEMNPELRSAIDQAKAVNMPLDKIEGIIARAAGEKGAGDDLEEVILESFGPGNVAFIVEAITDNKNRTLSELRHLISQNGGRVSEKGSVLWMFDRVGAVELPRTQLSEQLELAVIEAGASDIQEKDGVAVISAPPGNVSKIVDVIRKAGKTDLQKITISWQPKEPMVVEDEKTSAALRRLIEALVEHDDVQQVWTNTN